MKAKLLCIVFALILMLTPCGNKLIYSTGRDTAECFGNGRYQLLRSHNNFDCVEYILYDFKTDETVIDDVFGFVEIDKSIYLSGYFYNNDNVIETRYVKINENNNKYIQNTLDDFTEEDKNAFSQINRYIGFLEGSHYSQKFDENMLQYPVCSDTITEFCQGKYQVLYGTLINNYSTYLYDFENDKVVLDGIYGYCSKDDKHYMWGLVRENNYSPMYIIINENYAIVKIKDKEKLTKEELAIFEDIEPIQIYD